MPVPVVERSQKEIEQMIRKKISAIKDVKACFQITVGPLRKKPQIHLHVWLDKNISYEGMHNVSSHIEREVRKIVPNASVAIRTEPHGTDYYDVWKLVKDIANKEPGSRGAHNIHIQELDGTIGVDFHLEVSAGMTVKKAHDVAIQIEKKLKSANAKISEVIIHEESIADLVYSERTATGSHVRSYIEHIVRQFPEIIAVHKPKILKMGDEKLHVVLRCTFDPSLSIDRAAEVTAKLQEIIRAGNPRIDRIDITEEPA